MKKKPLTKEERALFLGDNKSNLDDDSAKSLIDKIMEGQDAPLTEQIYGDPNVPPVIFSSANMVDKDPLIEFIELYQPSTMVGKKQFRQHLLKVLDSWK